MPEPTGKELHVTVEIMDWFLMLSATGKAVAVVYHRHPKMVLLGDKSRTFKPGFPQSIYVSMIDRLCIFNISNACLGSSYIITKL